MSVAFQNESIADLNRYLSDLGQAARAAAAELAYAEPQHKNRALVAIAAILDQRRERIDGHADGRVLHDDGRPFAAQVSAGAEPHTFVLLVRRDVKDVFRGFDFFDNTGQLLAWHRGDEGDFVLYEIGDDPLILVHG